MTQKEIQKRWEKVRDELEAREASEEEMIAIYLVAVVDPVMKIVSSCGAGSEGGDAE